MKSSSIIVFNPLLAPVTGFDPLCAANKESWIVRFIVSSIIQDRTFRSSCVTFLNPLLAAVTSPSPLCAVNMELQIVKAPAEPSPFIIWRPRTKHASERSEAGGRKAADEVTAVRME